MNTHVQTNGQDQLNETAAHLVAVEPTALMREVKRLRTENLQLAHALESRVVIEQAKGILVERYRLTVMASFELLRHAARSNRMNIHELARKVVSSPETPHEFDRVLPQVRAR
jgi:AmiR/NasT family two-component response regulator